MKRFIGFIFLKDDNNRLISKAYDDVSCFDYWFMMHNGCDHLYMPNSIALERFFKQCEDPDALSEEELIENGLVRKLVIDYKL